MEGKGHRFSLCDLSPGQTSAPFLPQSGWPWLLRKAGFHFKALPLFWGKQNQARTTYVTGQGKLIMPFLELTLEKKLT